MSTVAEVADRAFRDWLHAPEDQPVTLALDGDVSASATTLTYDDSVLAPDEEDLLAAGVLVEIGSELARIRAVDDSANTLTVTRGVNGTTAAAHSDGDEIFVAPMFARSTLIEAVKDNVVALYPSLWRVDTEEVTSASTYVEVPDSVITSVGIFYLSGSRLREGSVSLVENFPPSSTRKAIVVRGIPNGTTAYFTYRGRFERPDEITDLSRYGVRPEWERIVVLGAVAQVVASRDLDALSAEYITEQLERDALPVEAPQRIRNGLLTLYNLWIDDAHRVLSGEQPTPVSMMT